MLDISTTGGYRRVELRNEIAYEKITSYYGALNIYAYLQTQVARINTTVMSRASGSIPRPNIVEMFEMFKKYEYKINPYFLGVNPIAVQEMLTTCVDAGKRRVSLALGLIGQIIDDSLIANYNHNLEELHRYIVCKHGARNFELAKLLKLVDIDINVKVQYYVEDRRV